MELSLIVAIQSIIFLLLTAYIYFKICMTKRIYRGKNIFRSLAASTTWVQLFSTLVLLHEYGLAHFGGFILNCFYIGMFIMTAQVALFAFMYLLYLYDNTLEIKGKLLVIYVLPSVMMALTSIASPWTHWVFYLDEQLVYHRGTLMILQLIFPYSYMLGGVIILLFTIFGKEKTRVRVLINSLLLIVPCMIGSLLQVGLDINGGYSMIGSCVSLVLLYIDMYVQENQRIEYLEGVEQLNSELQVLNKSLEEARNSAQIANESKTRFLFNMSHDIRTPMNSITGFLRLIRKNIDDKEKIIEYLDKMEISSRYLLKLINNVLEMSRIESGNDVINEELWDAREFNDILTFVIEEQMEAKGIRFTRSVDVVHDKVYCDSVKVQEIFFNILNNALKFTPKGGSVRMELTETESDRPGYAMYRTVITDTGPGISEEFLPHVFEKFMREKSSTESKIQGSGLGMSIVKRLAELLDGTVEIESTVGKGTRVIVCLPHRIATEEAVEEKENSEKRIEQSNFKNKRVLLAEDNDMNSEIAIEILNEYGFDVERAEDGVICVYMIEHSEAGYYDLILMDVQMPNLDGYGAARQIRALSDPVKANIPIIAMTANAFAEDKQNALDAGMNGHLSKPIQITKLVETMSEILN